MPDRVFVTSVLLGILNVLLVFRSSCEASGFLGTWKKCGNESTGFANLFKDVVPNFMKNLTHCSEYFNCKSDSEDNKCSSQCRNKCAFGNSTGIIDEDGKFSDEKATEFMTKFSDFQRKEKLLVEFKECGSKESFTYENGCKSFDGLVDCVIRKFEETCSKK